LFSGLLLISDGTKTTKKAAQNPLFEKKPKTFGIGEYLFPLPVTISAENQVVTSLPRRT